MAASGDVRVTKTVVNGGKNVIVGTSKTITFPIAITVTVTGKLTRANWETLKYNGFGGQPVQLQFKKKGAARYTTVKTVKSGSAGKLSTKATVTSAGSWRWYFPGLTTTARVASAGDAVTLK